MPTRRTALVLCALCLGSWLVVVLLGTRLTFFNDDWYFLLQRPGLESHGGLNVLFAPHNSNLVPLTAASYKVLVAVFGLGSQLPFRILIGLTVVAVGVMVFLLVSERVGRVIGLACAAVVLFLGPAWEDLLFFGAAIDIAGALAAGLAALWVLEQDRAGADLLACLLLVCSVGFSNVGLPFALGAAVAILLRRTPGRLWIAVVPVALFGLWWGLEGSSQPSHVTAHNLIHVPAYVLDSISAGLASLTGLHGGTVTGTHIAGRILLGVVAVVIAFALWQGWRPRSSVLVPLVVALGFWGLTGASFIPGRAPFASRYQLIDVVLLMLIGAELIGTVRLRRAGVFALAALTTAVVASNVADQLAWGYRFLRSQSSFAKADLGALELGRATAPRDLWLVAGVARNPFLSGVTAGRFFAETDAHGRVATYSRVQIAAAAADQRHGADSVLAFAERLTPQRIGIAVPAGPCTRVRTSPSGLSGDVALGPGTWVLTERHGGGLGIGVRRFAPPGRPSYVGLIAPGIRERLTVPPDALGLPWRLNINAADPTRVSTLRVCRA